ncbi:MAG: peptide deformylase [bacterium]|nr:peptide deformylase [bacterium]
MAVRIIRQKDDTILREVSLPIKRFDQILKVLVDDMIETMRFASGVGLAAPQIGVPKRVVVVEYEEELFIFINPEIISHSGEEVDIEGCLSIVGVYFEVRRYINIRVKANRVDGSSFEMDCRGFLSQAIQHEIDHLDGKMLDECAIRVVPRDEMEESE